MLGAAARPEPCNRRRRADSIERSIACSIGLMRSAVDREVSMDSALLARSLRLRIVISAIGQPKLSVPTIAGALCHPRARIIRPHGLMPILLRHRAVSEVAPRHRAKPGLTSPDLSGRGSPGSVSRHQASGGFVVNALGLVS